jgi:hypothetical protein
MANMSATWHWCTWTTAGGQTERRVVRGLQSTVRTSLELDCLPAACAGLPSDARCFAGVAAPHTVADVLQAALSQGAAPSVWDRTASTLHTLDCSLAALPPLDSSVGTGIDLGLEAWASSLPEPFEERALRMAREGGGGNLGGGVGLSKVIPRLDERTPQVLIDSPLDARGTRARIRAEVLLYVHLWEAFDKAGAGELRELYEPLRATAGVSRHELQLQVLDHARRLAEAGGSDSRMLELQIQLAEQIGRDGA